VNVLRLRKQNGKVIFTLKQSDVGNHLAKLEKEVEVKDLEIMEQIILLLGFKLVTQVKKNRLKCKVGDLEVCIDEVEGLGNFIEVEKMTLEDPKLVQQEMQGFLTSFGIDIANQFYEGYDVLMFKQKQL
jgi:adenylate cyclase class 2